MTVVMTGTMAFLPNASVQESQPAHTPQDFAGSCKLKCSQILPSTAKAAAFPNSSSSMRNKCNILIWRSAPICFHLPRCPLNTERWKGRESRYRLRRRHCHCEGICRCRDPASMTLFQPGSTRWKLRATGSHVSHKVLSSVQDRAMCRMGLTDTIAHSCKKGGPVKCRVTGMRLRVSHHEILVFMSLSESAKAFPYLKRPALHLWKLRCIDENG